MILYNSLGQTKQEFIPHTAGKVNMYTCGPTVYHFAHIGNLRTYIMEDVLEKYLRFAGYDVKRVMNITDVGHLSSDADTGEDKMLKGAKREHKTVMEIAKFYTDAFFEDCKKLNIKRPDVVEPATNCIDEFIHMISVLLEKGYAYIAGGNVYFDTSKLDNYYVFGNMNEDDLAVGVRDSVEEDNNKRNKADFVLWFTKSKFDSQELKWESHGASVIRAGILNVQLSAVSTTASISTFTAAVLTTHFLIIQMKLHRARLTSVISGASIGSMYSTSMMQEVK